MIDDRAWLSINNVLITDLDVSSGHQSGALRLATEIVNGSGISGKSIEFNDVLVIEVVELHGPTSGELTKSDSYIAITEADVDVSLAYGRATFEVPQGLQDWSMGIGFRMYRGDDYESDYLLFQVNKDTWWSMSHATSAGGEWDDSDSGFSDSVDVKSPISNHLEVFFCGQCGLPLCEQ